MSKRKRNRTPARRRAPLNLRPAIDPKRPETWGPPVDARGKLIRPEPKADPIETMFERGHLTPEERNAAIEIGRIFRMIAAGLFAKAASMDAARGTAPDLDKLVDAYTARYRPWADVLTRQRNAHDDPTHQIVIDAVVDGISCRDMDRMYRWRKGNAANCLRNGLRLYAVMAGWQKTTAWYDADVAA